MVQFKDQQQEQPEVEVEITQSQSQAQAQSQLQAAMGYQAQQGEQQDLVMSSNESEHQQSTKLMKKRERLPLQDREGGSDHDHHIANGGGEEKKDLDEDWHASIRGPSISMAAQEKEEKIKKRRRGNRASLDGTRRFRKVVTFRNSLVQTREIAGRRRGRNSLLPWFSSNAQEHTQEVLEEQERQRQQRAEEKAAKKQAKKEEKEAKKAAKEAAKAEKKAARKAAKEAKKQKESNRGSMELQSFVFEENDGGVVDNEMDMSLSVRDIMGDSSFANGGGANSSSNRDSTNNEDSFAVDHSRRRRSSVGTALLNTMQMFSGNRKQREQQQRFPRNGTRAGAGDQDQSRKSKTTAGDYDWSTHLRSSSQAGKSSSSSLDAKNNVVSFQKQGPYNKRNQGMERQKSQQDLIEEEEDAFEQGMLALPKTNPTGLSLNDSAVDFNASFAQAQNPYTSAIFNTSAQGNSSLNNSMDISGDSFADPNAPDLPKNAPRRGRRKKSILGGVFGSSNSKKKTPNRKPTPKRLTSIQEARSLGPPKQPKQKGRERGNLGGSNNSCMSSSISGPLADVIAMDRSS